MEAYILGSYSAYNKSDLSGLSRASVLSLGTALERTWGSFRYNVYIFSGLLFTVLAVFGLYAFYYFRYGVEVPLSVIGLIGTNYITMSIFLAFAAIIRIWR